MRFSTTLTALALAAIPLAAFAAPEGDGWEPLFNGKDFSGWKHEAHHNEIWTVKDGVIDCNPRTDIEGEKSLYTEKDYGDIELYLEWRITGTPGEGYNMPVVLPDGTDAVDAKGEKVLIKRPNADSGVYLRGMPKAQVNIWCWPIGSGEVYGYRNDDKMPAEVRAGVTPKGNADRPVGEWNVFHITIKGDRLTVVNNGVTVIDKVQLPGLAETGPLVLQHHGGYNPETKEWNSASSLVQFREVYVRPAP